MSTKPISFSDAVGFLRDSAEYFRNRDTHGEDRAHWANIHNAENCERIIDLLFELREGKGLTSGLIHKEGGE